MPNENGPPLTPGAQAIMRARGMLNRTGGAIRDYAERQIGGLRNATRDWRQTLDVATNSIIPGDWYDSQTRRWQNPLTGRDFGAPRTQPGQPVQPGQVPSNQMPGAPDPSGGLPALPNHTDPNQVGPPTHLAGRTPMPRLPATPAGPRGVNRGNHTIAQGPSAVAFGQGIYNANSGIRSSSYGRDQLNNSQREK
jgi:hypothetical protein